MDVSTSTEQAKYEASLLNQVIRLHCKQRPHVLLLLVYFVENKFLVQILRRFVSYS